MDLTIRLCNIYSILSTRAIAFVVDFSVQNSVDINQNNFAASRHYAVDIITQES
jgi:hypothetical protein